MNDMSIVVRTPQDEKTQVVLQSICHSVDCAWAALYCPQTGGKAVASFGTMDGIAALVEARVLGAQAFELARGSLVTMEVPDEDAAPGLTRFIAMTPVYGISDVPCGLLVVADQAPRPALSAAKQFVVKAHAAMLAELISAAAFGGPGMSTESGSGLTEQGEAARIERLRLLESVVVNANDAVLITEAEPIDAPGPRILYCNAAFTRSTGWTEAEIIGKTPRILQTNRTDRTKLDKLRAALVAWEPIELELLNKRKDGSEFWVELSIVPVANEVGWYTHWVSVQRDITDRKAAEEVAEYARRIAAENLLLSAKVTKSEEAEKELTEAHRIARMGMWRLAADRTTMVWSSDVYAMFGLPKREQPPTVDEMMAVIRPRDRAGVKAGLQAVFDRREPRQIEFAIPIGTHDVRYCRIEARPVLGAEGSLDGAFGFCQDITQHKKAEQALLRSERLKTLGQLTGGIAHDFNNLLTVTTLNIEEAVIELEPGHPAHELLKPALIAAERAAELTSSLLSYALQAQLRPKYIDVGKMLGELSSLLGRTLGEQHSVHIRPGSLTDELHADPAQLENALMNLAINARDAMPEGGRITICASRRAVIAGTVCLDGEIATGEYAVLEVADEGTGMSPELLTRVFEPFFTTKAPHHGSGLGLSMVYGFARQSGGYVGIESTPGRGTTVSLYFPLKPAVDVSIETAAAKSQWQAEGLRVLVVEDQVPVLKAVTRMLQQFGCIVEPVETAGAALSAIEQQPAFSLLFSDIVLPPPMSGTDLAAEAKRLSPGLRVLLTSGFAENGQGVGGESWCDEFLSKPYGREKLRSLLSRMFA